MVLPVASSLDIPLLVLKSSLQTVLLVDELGNSSLLIRVSSLLIGVFLDEPVYSSLKIALVAH